MNTMFDFVRDICVNKGGDLMQTQSDEQEFSPYVIQRFISFCSSISATIVNSTTNKAISVLDKQQLYKLWMLIVPKHYSTPHYIKGYKVESDEVMEACVEYLAKVKELSRREVMEYVTQMNIDLEMVKEAVK